MTWLAKIRSVTMSEGTSEGRPGKVLKFIAAVFAFMTGLWTFHWNIDATLEKHEHDVVSETFQRLERQFITARETELSSHPLSPIVTDLQAYEEARWGIRIHKLLAHDFFFTEWFFHPPGQKLLWWAKREPSEELKRLEAYEQYRAFALNQSLADAKASLFRLKPGKVSEGSIFLMTDTIVAAGIYVGIYRDGRHAVEELLKEARQVGSPANVVKALEALRERLSAAEKIH